MTFAEAEQYLISLCNMPRQEFMKDPRKCGVYLERTKFFLKLIGSPEKKIPHYIHITGTSGKGSVAAFMESILRSDGKKTGMLTSPHAATILERWQINGKQMTEKEFVSIVKFIKPKLDEYIKKTPHDMVSFHELTDIIGFYYFAKHKVDWAILEVGMGGRYCSSNVIPHKDAAIITNIGWDHKRLIGPSKKLIAYEKAGIITSNCPVFTMEKSKQLRDIFHKEAKKAGAVVNYIEPDQATVLKNDIYGTKYEYAGERYNTSCGGTHQVNNAILCTRVASSLGVGLESIKKGLKQTKQPLRMEILRKSPTLIVDGAHNKEKVGSSVEILSRESNIHLIVGFSGDKDIKSMILELAKLKPKSIACTRNTMNVFRKVADPKTIAKMFKQKKSKAKIRIFLDPKDALSFSRKQAKKDDIILATGSVFLGGEIRRLLTKIK